MGNAVEDLDVVDVTSPPQEQFKKYEVSDFPDGNIKDKLGLQEPDKEVDISQIQDGKYFIEGFPFNIVLGDDLKEPGPRPVEIVTAGIDNGLTEVKDTYTATDFKEGDKVTYLGDFKTPVSLDTLRAILIDDQKENKPTSADITLDENGQEVNRK